MEARQRAAIVPLVVGVTCAQAVWLVGMSFGVATSCTNASSCSSSDCAPCRIVSVATFGGFGLALVAAAIAVFAPWPLRQRRAGFIAVSLTIAALAAVVASTWSGPS